jgi:hypothetical protein
MSSKRKAEKGTSDKRESKQTSSRKEGTNGIQDLLPQIFRFVFSAYEGKELEIEDEPEDDTFEKENNSSDEDDDKPSKK